MSCRVVLSCCVVLCCVVLRCVALRCIVLCRAGLCCVVLYCIEIAQWVILVNRHIVLIVSYLLCCDVSCCVVFCVCCIEIALRFVSAFFTHAGR